MSRTTYLGLSLAAVLAVSVGLIGCGTAPAPQPVAGSAAEPAHTAVPADEHGHTAGGHGGQIISIGRDNYHAEVIVAADGTLRFYTLGKDETAVIDIEVQPLTLFAQTAGGQEASEIPLTAQPQPGDQPGRTSLFVGTLPATLRGQPVAYTLPLLNINGERFRVAFEYPARSTGEHAAAEQTMPKPVPSVSPQLRELYLSAAGKYTTSDIEANGYQVARLKYAGFHSEHDLNPLPGDKICPVTKTKANPALTWVIDGQKYEFCCPPCVDEFVKTAKLQPEEIQPAESYRQEQD